MPVAPSIANNRARTRLVQQHKAEFDIYYQQELNALGVKTRNQRQEELTRIMFITNTNNKGE
jgi:hypothetical protein